MAGLSVAFDASCEEMWLAWRSGATLVAAPRSIVRSGEDLGQWIMDNGITAVFHSADSGLAVATGGSRSGSAPDLRWRGVPARSGCATVQARTEVWNTYGPTETTVIACGAPRARESPFGSDAPARMGTRGGGRRGKPVGWGESGELIIGESGWATTWIRLWTEQVRPDVHPGFDARLPHGRHGRGGPEGLVFAGRVDDQIKFADAAWSWVRSTPTSPTCRGSGSARQHSAGRRVARTSSSGIWSRRRPDRLTWPGSGSFWQTACRAGSSRTW